MQWMIDLIVDVIKTQIGYFDRGDPATSDWELTDLIADNNWHDLNLSAIVPSGARIVRFNVIHQASNPAARFMMRTNGNVNTFNIASIGIQMSNNPLEEQLFCAPDADRIIEYRVVPSGTNVLRITVCGWWL